MDGITQHTIPKFYQEKLSPIVQSSAFPPFKLEHRYKNVYERAGFDYKREKESSNAGLGLNTNFSSLSMISDKRNIPLNSLKSPLNGQFNISLSSLNSPLNGNGSVSSLKSPMNANFSNSYSSVQSPVNSNFDSLSKNSSPLKPNYNMKLSNAYASGDNKLDSAYNSQSMNGKLSNPYSAQKGLNSNNGKLSNAYDAQNNTKFADNNRNFDNAYNSEKNLNNAYNSEKNLNNAYNNNGKNLVNDTYNRSQTSFNNPVNDYASNSANGGTIPVISSINTKISPQKKPPINNPVGKYNGSQNSINSTSPTKYTGSQHVISPVKSNGSNINPNIPYNDQNKTVNYHPNNSYNSINGSNAKVQEYTPYNQNQVLENNSGYTDHSGGSFSNGNQTINQPNGYQNQRAHTNYSGSSIHSAPGMNPSSQSFHSAHSNQNFVEQPLNDTDYHHIKSNSSHSSHSSNSFNFKRNDDGNSLSSITDGSKYQQSLASHGRNYSQKSGNSTNNDRYNSQNSTLAINEVQNRSMANGTALTSAENLFDSKDTQIDLELTSPTTSNHLNSIDENFHKRSDSNFSFQNHDNNEEYGTTNQITTRASPPKYPANLSYDPRAKSNTKAATINKKSTPYPRYSQEDMQGQSDYQNFLSTEKSTVMRNSALSMVSSIISKNSFGNEDDDEVEHELQMQLASMKMNGGANLAIESPSIQQTFIPSIHIDEVTSIASNQSNFYNREADLNRQQNENIYTEPTLEEDEDEILSEPSIKSSEDFNYPIERNSQFEAGDAHSSSIHGFVQHNDLEAPYPVDDLKSRNILRSTSFEDLNELPPSNSYTNNESAQRPIEKSIIHNDINHFQNDNFESPKPSIPTDNFEFSPSSGRSYNDSVKPLSPKSHHVEQELAVMNFKIDQVDQSPSEFMGSTFRTENESIKSIPKHPSGTGPCRSCHNSINPHAKGPERPVFSKTGELSGQWHRVCFSCSYDQCDVVFNKHVQCYAFEDFPYCKHHYHIVNNTVCENCHLGIEGECIENELGQKWHLNCLRCQKCQNNIKDDYYLINNLIFCEHDATNIINGKSGYRDSTGRKTGLSTKDKIEKRRTRLLFLD